MGGKPRPWKSMAFSMAHHEEHQVWKKNWVLFSQRVKNIRPWPGQGAVMGECKQCGSTISMKADV